MAENPSRAVIEVAEAIGLLIAGGSDLTSTQDEGGSSPGTTLAVLAAVAVGFGSVIVSGMRRVRKGLLLRPQFRRRIRP